MNFDLLQRLLFVVLVPEKLVLSIGTQGLCRQLHPY
jgi:hypothetical protein